jgi:hypothetical protein
MNLKNFQFHNSIEQGYRKDKNDKFLFLIKL